MGGTLVRNRVRSIPWGNSQNPVNIVLTTFVFKKKCPAITNKIAETRTMSRPADRDCPRYIIVNHCFNIVNRWSHC